MSGFNPDCFLPDGTRAQKVYELPNGQTVVALEVNIDYEEGIVYSIVNEVLDYDPIKRRLDDTREELERLEKLLVTRRNDLEEIRKQFPRAFAIEQARVDKIKEEMENNPNGYIVICHPHKKVVRKISEFNIDRILPNNDYIVFATEQEANKAAGIKQ